MKPLDPKFLEGIETLENPTEKQLGELNERMQRAKDAAVPVRENQGAVFAVGEVLEIRGSKFRVHAITENRLYLDSIPSK